MSVAIEQKIKEILKADVESDIPIGEIGNEVALDSLGINSVNFIKFVVDIETEFDIEFDDNDLNFNNFKNIACLVDYVEARL